jgi:hypothetical protein
MKMKRIIKGMLALLLALSLCACRNQAEQTAAPIEERTAEEIVRTAMNVTKETESMHLSGELKFGITLKDGLGTKSQPEEGAEEVAESTDQIAVTVAFDADCTYAPMAMKGSFTMTLEESYNSVYTDEQTVQFCLWEQDGKTVMAFRYGGDDRWVARSMPMQELGTPFDKYADLIQEGIFNFARAGEDTVNGVPVTLYTCALGGEGVRRILDTLESEIDGIPPVTFSDELVAKLKPIGITYAIGADDRPVRISVDAAAFADTFIETVVGPMIGEQAQSIAVDTFTIDVFYSDFNAVGPIAPPEDYIDYTQNALSSVLTPT